MARQLRRDDFMIGWVCALPVELAAAQEMFDEEHPDIEHDATANDENLYAFGTISGHNVVVVCLPAGRIGNNPASAAIMQMRATFKQIRFLLMVGIGGGVPITESGLGSDVRLGDVVVSCPNRTYAAGLVHYDASPTSQDGFVRTEVPNLLPRLLLSAVATVRTNGLLGRSKLGQHMARLEHISLFRRSEAGPDILFKASYRHVGGQTCDGCNPDSIQSRQSREEEDEVVIHYGTIATGNWVIKDAVIRGQLSSALGGVLCFEMEAAGLMDILPCLIVRGICDYADSHKNKRWHPYAAGTAAAYAKDLLSAIPSSKVEDTPTIEEAMRNANARPVSCIPFLRNRHFVGRCVEIDELRRRLVDNEDCKKMSIIGLGGTGKTQVALEFAYRTKEARPNWSIIWLPAVSMERFEQAYLGVAKALGILQATSKQEDPKELVQQRLSSGRVGSWLLIVDSADDPDVMFGTAERKGIVDYLPESTAGIILYTTRSPQIAELTPGTTIELAAMDLQDAENLLTRSLARKDDLTTIELKHQLLDELTCLPLAIAQAAAYMNRTRLTVSQYLHILRNTEQDFISLMSKGFRDSMRYKDSANAVATTWAVSFSQLIKQDTVAAELLEFMSCIEWKAIPRSLLPLVRYNARAEDAIGTLCGHSFLARRQDGDSLREVDSHILSGGEEWFDMHRLVHTAVRVWIEKNGDAAGIRLAAVEHVTEVFPSDEFTDRKIWEAYLPHALRLLRNHHVIEETMVLRLRVGRCLLVDGRVNEAIGLLEPTCRYTVWNVEDPQTLVASQQTLAMLYRVTEQAHKAVELLKAVVRSSDHPLLQAHPDQLAWQLELATSYQADGDAQKAVALLCSIVEAREDSPPSETLDRFELQGALVTPSQANGQLERAVELLKAAVAAQETMRVDHPGRLASQSMLACAYEMNGQLEKAIKLQKYVLEVESQVLIADHPHLLTSRQTLAMMYHADGQLQKAKELLDIVVDVKSKALDANHPDRLASEQTLARLCREIQTVGETNFPLAKSDLWLIQLKDKLIPDLQAHVVDGAQRNIQVESDDENTTLVGTHSEHASEELSTTILNMPDYLGDDDCRSVISNHEDIGSQTAMRKSQPELLAVRQFGTFFAQLEELRPLHEEALSRLGTTRFRENYRRIFKRYVLKLQTHAQLPVEKDIVLVLKSRTNRVHIAQQILSITQPEKNGSSKPYDDLIMQPVEKLIFEDWAKSVYTTPPETAITPEAINDYTDELDVASHEDEDEIAAEKRDFPNIAQANIFLRSELPFQALVRDLRMLILPAPIREVVECTPKTSITISSVNDTSLTNTMKTVIEDYTRVNWDWWPLMPRVPDLARGKLRLQWTICGQRMFMSITTEQAKAIEQALAFIDDHPPDCYCCNSTVVRVALIDTLSGLYRLVVASIGKTLSSTSGSRNPMSKAQQQYTPAGATSSASSSATTQGTSQPAPAGHSQHQATGSVATQGGSTGNPPGIPPVLPSWVIFGLQNDDFTRIETIDMSRLDNDRLFFRELKARHNKHRWFLQQVFSPFRFRNCRFVRFETIDAERIYCSGEALPDEHGYEIFYEYTPRPPKARNPLIDQKLFSICLKACDVNCHGRLLPDYLHTCRPLPLNSHHWKRIPRKESDFSLSRSECGDVVFGLEADYSLSFAMVVVYHIVLLVGAFSFWIYWLNTHPGDLQNASVPSLTALGIIGVIWALPWKTRELV